MSVQSVQSPSLQAHDYSGRALLVLKQNGYRLTEPRKQVIEILALASVPLAAYEMKDLLAGKGFSTDVTSIYRIIECLEKNHLLHKTFQQGKVFRCELEDAHSCDSHTHPHNHSDESLPHEVCHHFMLCRGCGKIQEIHCFGLDDIAQDLQSRYGFQAESHLLQISGLCQPCQS